MKVKSILCLTLKFESFIGRLHKDFCMKTFYTYELLVVFALYPGTPSGFLSLLRILTFHGWFQKWKERQKSQCGCQELLSVYLQLNVCLLHHKCLAAVSHTNLGTRSLANEVCCTQCFPVGWYFQTWHFQGFMITADRFHRSQSDKSKQMISQIETNGFTNRSLQP